MKVYLIKNVRNNTSFCLLETKHSLLVKKEGKIGGAIGSSTKNCGTEEKAIAELKLMASNYQNKGYLESVLGQNIEPITFDKAKWHFNGDFPSELDEWQAYLHTGFYIGWLLRKGLMNDDFISGNRKYIEKFLDDTISPVSIYSEIMDGVFTSENLTVQGIVFTNFYFDFGSGRYLADYESTLARELPTLYHVEDTKANFDKICAVIEDIYNDWSLHR